MAERYRYNSDSLWRIYESSGAEMALRYAAMSEQSREREERQTRWEPRVLWLRFYTPTSNPTDGPPTHFTSSFPRSKTDFVCFAIDVEHPRRHVSFKYTIVARYYQPDGSLLGEVKDEAEVEPGTDAFTYANSWGWKEPGRWPVGVYRVEILLDGKTVASESFTIEEDRPLLFGKAPIVDYLKELDLDRAAPDQKPSGTPSGRGKRGADIMSENKPKGLGLEGWLNKFQQEFPTRPRPDLESGKPLDDVAKLQWSNDLDRRYMVAMVKAQPGKADANVVQELRDLAAEYEKLLQAGLPTLPLYTSEAVRAKTAELHNIAGRAYESLHDDDQAMKEYALAAASYRKLGRLEDSQRCSGNLARLQEAQKGGSNAEFERLQAALAKLPAGSVDHAETLIDLAGLHARNNDDHEAEKLFLQAERELDKLEGDPSGGKLAQVLASSLQGLLSGTAPSGLTSIETTMRIRGLYRVLSMGLARIYQTSQPIKAQYYADKAASRDSRKQNDAFSEAMMQALRGQLGGR
jgi:hypothetical protein